MFFQSLDGGADQVFEYIQVHILQFIDVQASLPVLVLAQVFQDVLIVFQVAHYIDTQAMFPGGEAAFEPVPFPSGGIFIVIITESDNGFPPHPSPGSR